MTTLSVNVVHVSPSLESLFLGAWVAIWQFGSGRCFTCSTRAFLMCGSARASLHVRRRTCVTSRACSDHVIYKCLYMVIYSTNSLTHTLRQGPNHSLAHLCSPTFTDFRGNICYRRQMGSMDFILRSRGRRDPKICWCIGILHNSNEEGVGTGQQGKSWGRGDRYGRIATRRWENTEESNRGTVNKRLKVVFLASKRVTYNHHKILKTS